ncbi:hypothetical protein NXY56_005719 [Leishmania guyanensis]|uniref:Uncharacterized protein n=1 Tax=Leishmania guyanensis TaxID=5670 RepID=A0A1E1J3M9_LEIGU|nr:hypothetical protein, unknown function [Leishmania guyanensis]
MVGNVHERKGIKGAKQLRWTGLRGDHVFFEVLQHAMGVVESLDEFQQRNNDVELLDADFLEEHIYFMSMALKMAGLAYRQLWKVAIDMMRTALWRVLKY